MKERPILFSAPMVRAILEGRKTQTRRAVNGVADPDEIEVLGDSGEAFMHSGACESFCDYACGGAVLKCPYGIPGDRLWVKETFWKHKQTSFVRHADCASDASWKETGWRKVPSIHMPRWASRITLEIADVRVERLQDISEADAVAEGVRQMRDGSGCWVGREGPGKWVTPWAAAREAFCDIWESINGKGSWDANPWVWVIEFKRIEARP